MYFVSCLVTLIAFVSQIDLACQSAVTVALPVLSVLLAFSTCFIINALVLCERSRSLRIAFFFHIFGSVTLYNTRVLFLQFLF